MSKKDTELTPFQLEGAKQIYRFRGRALLADEMGLGKTLQSLYWLKKIRSYRPAVVVCPSSMKYTWQAEARLHFNMDIEVLEGKCKRRVDLPRNGILVLNYDILPTWLWLLKELRPRCLIVDEIHYIKNMGAQRTKALLRLAKEVPSVVGLSGTPLTNRPIELWSVLRAIRPDIFPDRSQFAWRYCAPRYTPWGWKFDGAVHLKELNRILREECMIRRLKSEVIKDLPKKQRRMVVFRLKSYKEYNHAKENFLDWLQKQSPARAKRAKRSQALTKIGYLIRLACQLKLPWTTKWIEEFLESHPEEKLVCFTSHTFVIDHLKAAFPTALVIDGRVTGRKRVEVVRQFRSHPRKRLMLGNWIAAGIGITLVASRNVAALDVPWTPGELLQGEDRCHRIGQKRNVIIHYLAALGTIEEKQMAILRRKTKVLDSVLDGRTSKKELNIFDELLDELKKENKHA
jgi:SWI/SNF-related matrix-associated actin-dependent regulator 1 of chromatin subfamily A